MVKRVKGLIKNLIGGQKGFTLIELLVVVAILGALVAVAIPNVGKFINSGKQKSWDTELHNVQTGVTALMADANPSSGLLDGSYTGIGTTNGFDIVTAGTGAFKLSEYLIGLDSSFKSKTKCSYAITNDGKVVQTPPP